MLRNELTGRVAPERRKPLWMGDLGRTEREGDREMRDRIGWSGIALLLAFASGAAEARAQDGTYAGPQNVMSTNPFGVVGGWYTLEYERRLNDRLALAFSGSYVSLDSDQDHYFSGNASRRCYPTGHALSGFYFGARTGVYDVEEGSTDDLFVGVGFELGYTWLLGEEPAFQISLGAGASRIIGGSIDDPEVLPHIRLVNVGLAC